MLCFALAISLISGLLFGLAPIVRLTHPRLVSAIGARTSTDARDQQRPQQSLVVLQVALPLMLLVSASLMLRSFQGLHRVDPGFASPHQVQTFSVSIPPTLVAEPERVTRMQQEVVDRIAALAGVESVAFTTRVPMGRDRSSTARPFTGRHSHMNNFKACPATRRDV